MGTNKYLSQVKYYATHLFAKKHTPTPTPILSCVKHYFHYLYKLINPHEQWGNSYILTKKGKDRASADVGFMFVAYNLRRLISILEPEIFKKYLSMLILQFIAKYYLYGYICFPTLTPNYSSQKSP